ncbi:MAG: sulfotransferase [Alphaproteobacteria bacterium]|nr:sulfotransferase [Alphaproteobacteria bacterium]
MLRMPPRPLQVRLADALDRASRRLGRDKAPITPEAAEQSAIALTGLRDFGPDDYREGLERFCATVVEDAQPDLIGRHLIRSALRRILANRLLLIERQRSAPEVFETPLRDPIVIVGLPRSGSTFLHRLLAEDPEAYAPPMWKLMRPFAIPGRDDRRQEVTRAGILQLRALAVDLDQKHFMDADAPEECFYLRDVGFKGPGLGHLCFAERYNDWVLSQDAGPSYDYYARTLRALQAEVPGRRLVLKAPSHTLHLRELEESVPGVRLIQTHREPRSVVPSHASLALSLASVSSRAVDPRRVTEMVLRINHALVDQLPERRAELRAPVVDLRYPELIADPIAAIRRLYAALEMELSPEAEQRMRQRVADRPKHKYGTHRYDLDELGLSEARIDALFAEYKRAFL